MLLVGDDLKKSGQEYGELITAIRGLGAWWHYLDSTWLVKTTSSVSAVRDALSPHVDGNDELLVIEVTRNAAWVGFDADASKWLKDNL